MPTGKVGHEWHSACSLCVLIVCQLVGRLAHNSMEKMMSRLAAAFLVGALAFAAVGDAFACGSDPPPDPCFDVGVNLLSVTPDGDGYIWKYEVCAEPCSNRGMSHWVMSICGDPSVPPWDLTLPDVDYFDMGFFDEHYGNYYYTTENGNKYKVELGTDPTTGVKGIKYEFVYGDQIVYSDDCDGGPDDDDGDDCDWGDWWDDWFGGCGDDDDEGICCDTFEFRLTEDFEVIERLWGAKDGNLPCGGGPLLDYGTAGGPACAPGGPPPSPPPVPEPATMLLLGLGAAGGVLWRRRRR